MENYQDPIDHHLKWLVAPTFVQFSTEKTIEEQVNRLKKHEDMIRRDLHRDDLQFHLGYHPIAHFIPEMYGLYVVTVFPKL